MNPFLALVAATAIGFLIACLFAGAVMWAVIHLQNRADEYQARLDRRLR